MMSLRALGNYGTGGSSAKLAATYYQDNSADYYGEDSDQQGEWIGQGADSLGLEGEVSREEFQLSLAGYVKGHEVQNAGKENRLMGWDATFSAPKSVSVVWAGADAQHKREIEKANQLAVDAAFGYLEAHTVTRRGKSGTIDEEAKLVACRYDHKTSRALDPELHTHVVISNFSVRDDGTVGTIDSRAFYVHKMAAGAVYQVELAYQMKKLGYEIENGPKGTFRLKDVTHEAEQVFSKRSKQINDLAKERGINSYEGTRSLVLETRANKEHSSLAEREEAWKQEAQEHKVSLSAERHNLEVSSIKSDHEILTQASEKLTTNHSTFKEKDLLRETAIASYGELNAEQVQDLIKEAQGQGYIVGLNDGLFSTPEMVKIEQGIIEHVDNMAIQSHYGVDAQRAIDHGIVTNSGERFDFSEEQRVAIEAATGDSEIAIIQGRAGTGKSTMLSAVRESYEEAGWDVQGIALSGNAAANLEKDSGIESRTIASWLLHAELDEHTVVIMDEASMVGSEQMLEVMEKVYDAGAKLIEVGDERQLQPISAGAALRLSDRRLAQIRPEYSRVMEGINRQKEAWMKEVVKKASQGRTAEALEQLNEKGKINFYQNPIEARRSIVEDFINKNKDDFSKGIILTDRIQDAGKINNEIHAELKERGLIDYSASITCDNGEKILELSPGDRIKFTRNDYNLDVQNGQRGTINIIDSSGILEVHLDNGENKSIDLNKYNNVDYGWADNTYKAQGATVERAHVYGFSEESMGSQQATYVKLSRAREETKLYIVAGERGVEREEMSLKMDEEQLKEVFEQMKESCSKDAAKDIVWDHISPLEFEKKEPEIDIKKEQGRGYER